jgi:cysteinyl-tRNA synthetase
MSKSLGNVLLVRELLAQAPGEAIRLALLSTHYRKPLDWNARRLQGARDSLRKYYEALARVEHLPELPQTAPDTEVLAALRNDLNIPGALVRLHGLLTQLNHAETDTERTRVKSVLLASAATLGLLQQSPQTALAALRPATSSSSAAPVNDARLKTLLAEREAARLSRDFAKSDALRAELEVAGFMVEDTPQGQMLRPVAKETA